MPAGMNAKATVADELALHFADFTMQFTELRIVIC
jgi:hypothetical protein